ncbi:MAG: ribosome small subunit-dependent GTPase A [Bryobacteraceae bacterium]
MGLEKWGWSSWFEKRASGLPGEPGRVVLVHREHCLVAAARGEVTAPVRGHLRQSGMSPAVGDWVLLVSGAIEAIVPRRTVFSRRRGDGEQVLAANLDVLVIVCGLDGDFNLRRIERYLVLASESGADPLVVLNKADLASEPQARLGEVRAIAGGAPVLLASASLGTGVDAIESAIGLGRTAALIGSSGAGKSTLVNRLLGRDAIATRAVRESDSRGRHTTTHRAMFALPSGALLIDMPGLRAVGLWAGEEAIERAFPDIAEPALECRFRDCRHEGEPGCAVAAQADAARLASYHKLRREAEWLERRDDPAKDAAHRKKIRAIHKAHRDPQI